MKKVTKTVCHNSKRPAVILKVCVNTKSDLHELNVQSQNSPCYLNNCFNFQSPEFRKFLRFSLQLDLKLS